MDRMGHSAQQGLAGAIFAAAALALMLLAGGCSTCRLPRIDPTGSAIFAPGTTTLDPQLGQLPTPEPAFVAPPAPPPCGQPMQPGCKKKHIKLHCDQLCAGIRRELSCVGDEGQLLVTPTRVIAPVGTEVVLLAGLCGPDRHFVARQPIEWILSQESVGNLVAVGEDGASILTRLYRSQPKKTDSGYAVGLSSASDQVVTRGTPQPNDDIHLGKGQAWLSVTSPSEGTSYITVLAPKAKNWDQRRQTVTIQWVDAQWQMPSPLIVPAGRAARLTTNVRRAGGTLPATGWIVRYEVTGGVPAGFAPGGQPAVEVPVDAQGNASVDMTQLATTPGATSVSIQILRPGLAGSAERIAVGQGFTSVTWSAPGLAVKVSGPTNIQQGHEATFRIDVTNPGDIVSRDVVVTDELPPILAYTGSNIAPQEFGNQRQWRLGDLPPRTTRTIEVRVQAVRGGEIRYRAHAQSADGVQAEDTLAARVAQPSLALAMSGPKTADVGETIQYRVEIANIGDQVLRNVTLTNRFDRGLEHAQGERSPIVRSLGDLNPGERRLVGITFVVREPGEHCHTLDASADGGELTTARECVVASVREVRNLQVTKMGPAEQVVGGTAEYTIEVTNTGNSPLTNVRIVDQYADSLEPKAATNGYTAEAGALHWTIPQLDPGTVVRRRVSCLCLKADPAAINRVTVTTREQVTGSHEVRTRITAAAPQPGTRLVPSGEARGAGRPEEPGNIDADGSLELSLREKADPATVGRLTYTISVANRRAVSDREIRLRVKLPEGMTFHSMTGRYAPTPSRDLRTVDIAPIMELRANEALDRPLELNVTVTAPGKYVVELEGVSQRSPTPVVAREETTVFAR